MIDILQGDVREVLKTLPDNHFDCIVTSPPYFGLRDYGVEGQIGLEPTLNEYLDIMVDVLVQTAKVDMVELPKKIIYRPMPRIHRQPKPEYCRLVYVKIMCQFLQEFLTHSEEPEPLPWLAENLEEIAL